METIENVGVSLSVLGIIVAAVTSYVHTSTKTNSNKSRIVDLEAKVGGISSVKTDIAIIKTTLEFIQKSITSLEADKK